MHIGKEILNGFLNVLIVEVKNHLNLVIVVKIGVKIMKNIIRKIKIKLHLIKPASKDDILIQVMDIVFLLNVQRLYLAYAEIRLDMIELRKTKNVQTKKEI